MSFNFVYFLTVVNFIFHRVTSEPLPFTNGSPSIESYSSNTPFSSESDMESFIRNEWRDYPTIDIQSLIDPLKQILYSSFNPNNTKIRICNDLPFSTYKDRQLLNPRTSQSDQIYIVTPSSLIPLKYFKWSMELLTILNDADVKLRDNMTTAVKTLNTLEKDGESEIAKFIKNCQAVVVVPHLFKSNCCVAGPIIEMYFPSLANVSLIKLGNIFLRYNSVQNLVQNIFRRTWNDTVGELENIPISEQDEIPFENLRKMVENFHKNHSSFYLKSVDEDESAAKTDIPLSHWTIVYDSLNTDVSKYLKSMTRQNGSKAYENLPWIGYRKNITNIDQNDIVSIPLAADFRSGEKSLSNGSGTSRGTVNEAIKPILEYYSPREGAVAGANNSNETDLQHLYHFHHEKVSESGDGSLQTADTFNIDDFHDSVHSNESTQPDAGEKLTRGGKKGTSFELDSPILGQIPHTFLKRKNQHKNQSTDERNNTTRKPVLPFHNTETNDDRDGSKNTLDRDINFPTLNPFTYSGTQSSKIDPDLPTALRSNCRKSNNKSNCNSKNIDEIESRISNRIGSVAGSKSYRSSHFKDTALKKLPKSDDLVANKKNRNLDGNFTPLKKDKIRNRPTGRHSIPILDHLVTSFRKNGIQSTGSLKDTFVEDLQKTFESSCV